MTKCFALYFEYLFPLIPIVHEPTMRAGLQFVLAQHSQQRESPHLQQSESPHSASWLSPPQQSSELNSPFDDTNQPGYPTPWPQSIFTLVTALCAESASILPIQLFPEGRLVANAFLKASRSALHEYLDADLEQPNANSLIIRYFHSNCLHAAGKSKTSWHIFGEAGRLAQIMQLHDETSYTGLDAVEALLRRRVFWILYIGDKSAALLNQRPITLHKFSFDPGITVAYSSEAVDHDGKSTGTSSVDVPEQSIMAGFNLNLRLWHAASDLLLELRVVREPLPNQGTGKSLTSYQRSHINSLYVNFMTCLDELPRWLQISPGLFGTGPDGLDHPKAFVIQWVNLRVSFHCLRMAILRKFEDYEFMAPGGVQEQWGTQTLSKTEIARDMLQALREAPFWALQVNGESCVSYLSTELDHWACK